MHEPNRFLPHAVYTKQLWADAWSLRPYLRAPEFTFACGPDMSSATLEYKYGNIMRHDAHDYAVFPPLDLSDRYVKIEVDGGPTWYGVVIGSGNDRGGEHVVGADEVVRGTQTFACRGLEFLLHRVTLDTSIVSNTNAANFENTIDRAIGFNLGPGIASSVDKLANKHPAGGARGVPIFAETLNNANEWSAADVLEYLLAYHTPTDINGLDSLGWFASRARYLPILENHTPAMQVHGKTVFQVLNELIDRRRLMGWCVRVDPNNEHPEIFVFTFNPNMIALEQGVVPANFNPVNWDFDQDNQVQKFVLATDDATRFDRVIARGEPAGGCFTISVQNSLLEPDWSTAQQTAYRAGATGDAAYAGLDSWQRHDANQQARTKDSLKKVYRYFRVPPDFDGYVGFNAVWPQTFPVRNFLLSRKCWWPGLRFQDRLPLRTEHDYQAVNAVTNAMKTSSKWEYQRPFAFFQESGRAYFLDRMSRGEEVGTHIESSGRFWSASLRMQDDALGVIIDCGGNPQHVIAKNTFTPIDADDETDYEAAIDYSYIYCTVFAEADGFVEERWPLNLLNVDYVKELIINVPNARLDYLVPGTVIDIDDEGAAVTTVGGFVRDDTDYLKTVARTAFEWYSSPRKSIRVTIRDLSETRTRGELVLAIGGANNAEIVNSVVTNCTYDMRAGTATYITQFAELDA